MPVFISELTSGCCFPVVFLLLLLWRPFPRSAVLSFPCLKIAGMLGIEANMRLRRERIAAHLPPGVIYTTLTNFPRLGCPDFTDPGFTPNPEGPVSQSLFFPDQAINPHPRFATLTANIRCRRQGKVGDLLRRRSYGFLSYSVCTRLSPSRVNPLA